MKLRVYLHIFSIRENPIDISRALGVVPDEILLAGTSTPSGRVREHSAIFVNSKRRPEDCVVEHIRWVLEVSGLNKEALRGMEGRVGKCVMIVARCH